MSLIGTLKSNRPGFYAENTLHDINSPSSMFFNQTQFPRRAEKETLSSHATSQSSSHLGNLYSGPSVSAPGSQPNYFGSGLASPGGLSTTSIPGPPGSSRGLTGSPQFSRSVSYPGYPSSHLSNAASGLQHLNSVSSAVSSSQPGSRGILSMGQRNNGIGLPSGVPHLGAQTAFNSLGSKATNRAPGLPTSTIGRSSPGIIAQQQPQQQPQQQQRSFLGGSGHGGLVNSTSNPLSSAFGPPRSQQNVFGLPASSMMNVFSSSGLSNNTDTISSVAAINSGLDLSDFPVLANRPMAHVPPSVSSPSSTATTSSFVGRASYGLVSKRGEPSTEFTMLTEDFPALPGTVSKSEQSSEPTNQEAKPQAQRFGNAPSYEQAVKDEIRVSSQNQVSQPVKGKIQTSPTGTITNIPKHMVTDQFGMIGLLTFIRAAETEPNLVTLALGSDLTTLGLNLNSTESLHQTFGSPFSDSPCRPHEIDFNVPPEYRINSYIREKLAPFKLSRYGEDVLFYLYYTNEGDVLQLAASAELYSREWRYHKDERVWLTRVPGVEPLHKANTYERGTYYFFDYLNWRKMAKEFHLEYDKLEEKPTLQPLATQ